MSETYHITFPIYKITLRKDDLNERQLASIRRYKMINLSRLNKFNNDDRFTSIILPAKESKEEITIVFSKKKLPAKLYIDFFITFKGEGSIYPSDMFENLSDFIEKVGKYYRYVECGSVVDYTKINTKLWTKTNDCLFKENTSLREWIDDKFGIKLPLDKPLMLEINYNIDPNSPFVLFRKKDDSDVFKCFQKIKDGKITNLYLSKNQKIPHYMYRQTS